MSNEQQWNTNRCNPMCNVFIWILPNSVSGCSFGRTNNAYAAAIAKACSETAVNTMIKMNQINQIQRKQYE